MRASSTVRSSCSVSARLVASLAVSSALRLPPATTLMMNEAMMRIKNGMGCLSMPARIRPRNETSSSAFHEIDGQPIEERPPHHDDALADLAQGLSDSHWPRGGTALAALGGVVGAWAALVGIHLVALWSPACHGARLREGAAGLQRGKTQCAPGGVKCRKPSYSVSRRCHASRAGP